MKIKTVVKLLSVLLCVSVLFGVVPLSASGKAEKTKFVSRLDFDIADDTVLRAVVVYDGDAALESVNKGNAPSVTTASRAVTNSQRALTAAVCAKGASVFYSYNTLLNGVAVDASYKQLKEIEKISGVKAVYLANTYSAPVVTDEAKTSAIKANYGTVPNKGKGAVIAVVDSSFRLTHEVFSSNGVSETLSKAGMEAIRDGARGLNGHGVYISAKVPFAYDYHGKDTDVGNSMSHGTAVAGIAAGNSGSYEGIAPYAQVLAMKVFDDSTGQTDSSVYFAALEDAYLLGADVINMSLGSQNGFSFDYELEDKVFGNIYETLKAAGVFVFGAAGNEFSQGYASYANNFSSKDNGIDAVTADYADYGVVSAPASYDGVIAVGSFNNVANATPSDFSSWGCTPELKLKPQISGIGGGVLCPETGTDTSYQYSSGTSMATPVVAGYFAAMKAYYKTVLSGVNGKAMYDFLYGIMLSYAICDTSISPRKQGAGIVNSSSISSAYFDSPIINLGDDATKSGVYSFTVNAYSLKENTHFSLKGANVLTDYVSTHNGRVYNTITPRRLNASVTTDKESYVLSQTPTQITVTIKLSAEDKEYFKQLPNGGFVEGYIEFDAADTTTDPHLTFMGFYGDWCAAPAMEKLFWGDVINTNRFLNTTTDPITGLSYAELGYTYIDMLETNVGYTEGYLVDAQGESIGMLGDNLYEWVSYDEKRLAISTAAANGYHVAESFVIYPSLLRNVRHIIMTVSNAATGEVYYVDDTEYGMKNYYDATASAFSQGTYFVWNGTCLDPSGELCYVPNDTLVNIRFETQLAYQNAPLALAAEYKMYIDIEAPKIRYDWDGEAKQLKVYATDNQYISNIFIHNGDYEIMYTKKCVTDSEKNKEYVAVFDLSGADFGTAESFTVEVQDYATNYALTEVVLNPSEYEKGDVNMDGNIDNVDAAAVLKYDAGISDLADIGLKAGDVNGDGEVNNIDAALILKYDAGIIDEF